MLSYDPNRDAYITLGVDPDASAREVEAAYRKAALTWHPDKSPAPDAADRFQEVLEAARILRDPRQRADYDRLRALHFGGRTMHRKQKHRAPPKAYAPLAPPPAWLAERVRVHFDAVIFNLKVPAPTGSRGRWADAVAFVALIVSLGTRDVKWAALALVFLFIARVLSTPPHQGILAWAKIVPGRRIAEYHALDQRADRYESWSVPFSRLMIAIVADGAHWRTEIRGFPQSAAPELSRTRSLDEARRQAREAGVWLRLPLREVA